MFTGIVTDVGEVLSVEERAEGLRRLTIASAYGHASIMIGASICCSGVCMTAVETKAGGGRDTFSVDAAAETLRLTTVGRWQAGTRVNLERSLKMGDELGGHLVSGHVDGLAVLAAR
jgi:riboflavin synthase